MDGLPPTRSWQPPEILRENVVALSEACVNESLKVGQAQDYVLEWATSAWLLCAGLAILTWVLRAELASLARLLCAALDHFRLAYLAFFIFWTGPL